MSHTPSGLKLELADSRRWLISPVDEKAAAIVARLGEVMCLAPACRTDGPGENVRELYVAVSGESEASGPNDSITDGTAVIRLADSEQDALSSPTSPALQAIGMERIASFIAREALVRDGLLLHAALAEYHGGGFVMAGPSGAGKSTASGRLPLPWHSLCDDVTLVVRDYEGRFWAHPWPTWNRFLWGGPGGSWPVEHAVPLRAVFFLRQSPSDGLEPVNSTQAAALLLDSAINLAQTVVLNGPTHSSSIPVGVRAARSLASGVTAYSLKLSLDGRFWEEVARVLPAGTEEAPVNKTKYEGPMTLATLAVFDELRFVYTGQSMNPTLREPDFLEVRPYGTGRARPGDVVCFKSPDTGAMVVHRVVSVGPRSSVSGRRLDGSRGTGDGAQEDIRTRGDNDGQDDPWVLRPEDVVGRVTAVQRGARRRAVPGGWRSLVVLRCARLGRGIRRRTDLLPHTLFRLAIGLGPFDRLLPRSRRPRVVRFDTRCRVFLKLLSGSRTVGQYDDRREEWYIQRPFRLFVNEQTLPRPESMVHGWPRRPRSDSG